MKLTITIPTLYTVPCTSWNLLEICILFLISSQTDHKQLLFLMDVSASNSLNGILIADSNFLNVLFIVERFLKVYGIFELKFFSSNKSNERLKFVLNHLMYEALKKFPIYTLHYI